VPARSWPDLLLRTAEFLIERGLIRREHCPITVGSRNNRYVIHSEPVNSRGTSFHGAKELSNGLYLESNLSRKDTVHVCELLLVKFGQDPSQFRVLLG